MSDLPCKNPSCKSVGRPHPNCRCYGNFAQGGEAYFCSSPRKHDPTCLYFAQGGLVDDENPNDAVAHHLINFGGSGILDQILNQPIEKYYSSIVKGKKNLDSSSKALFSDESMPVEDSSKKKKSFDEWMDSGNAYSDIQNSLAQGVDVKPDTLSLIHPQQNLLLQTSKGRIAGYLNSLKPQGNGPKLAFDDEQAQPEQKKTYEDALAIANSPLSILNHVKDGTIEPSYVEHFQAMYPEVNEMLQKKLTEQITKLQLEKKKPNFVTRQGLSLLMGVPLSSEFLPENIQAAQQSFQRAAPPPPPQPAPAQAPKNPTQTPKKSTSGLSKVANSFMTSDQTLTARSQKI